MSICRTIGEYNSEKDADEAHAEYTKDGPSLFPEAEIMLASRVGPATVVVNSIYPNQETAKKTMAQRKATMEKLKERIKSFETYQGEVTLRVVR